MSVQECKKFAVPVVYIHPSFEELRRRFPAYVSSDLEGMQFDPIIFCRAVSRERCEVTFEYIKMGYAPLTNNVLRMMNRKGFRPALYEELLCFAEKYPDEQLKYPIVALGSETDVSGDRSVAFLWHVGSGRSLGLSWVGCGWSGLYRFLAVRL